MVGRSLFSLGELLACAWDREGGPYTGRESRGPVTQPRTKSKKNRNAAKLHNFLHGIWGAS